MDEDIATTTELASDTGRTRARAAFADPTIGTSDQPRLIITNDPPYDASLAVNGKRSLANIGLQAFWLGFTCAASILLGAYTWHYGIDIWRLLAFLSVLSVFHFLEYWSTARFNVKVAQSNSFLLFTNGAAYNVAYLLAVLEIVISSTVAPSYGHAFTTYWSRGLGVVLILLGQVIRTIAMAQAGNNFNHIPQKIRREGHVLVTNGIYSVLRHPAYFGFFWWALGTQLLLGNKLCTVGYLFVLWHFFSRRVQVEEKSLMDFFGVDYKQYKAKTGTGIPFIR